MMILALVLSLLFAPSAWAGWANDGAEDTHVTMADHAALDFPDGDWTVAGYVRITNNAGTHTARQIYVFNAGQITVTTNPMFSAYCRGASASSPNELRFQINDDDTTEFTLAGGNTLCASTSWQRIIIENSGVTVTIYADGATVTTTDGTALGAMSFSDGDIAGRSGAGAPDSIPAEHCDWAKWNRVLTADEKAALNKGFSVMFFPGHQWLIPMVREYIELKNGIALTNDSTTAVPCPRMIYPS